MQVNFLTSTLPEGTETVGVTRVGRVAGDFRELRLQQPVFSRVVALLRRSPEFTLAVALRQDEANSGTILSFAHGYNRQVICKLYRKEETI